MFKGLFFGLLTGILVVAGGLVILSVVAPPPEAPQTVAPAVPGRAPPEISVTDPVAASPPGPSDAPVIDPLEPAPRAPAQPAGIATAPAEPARDRPVDAPSPAPGLEVPSGVATQRVPREDVAEIARDPAPRRGDPSGPPLAGSTAPLQASVAGLAAAVPVAPSATVRRDRPLERAVAPFADPAPARTVVMGSARTAPPRSDVAVPARHAAAPLPAAGVAPDAPHAIPPGPLEGAVPSAAFAPAAPGEAGPAPRAADAALTPLHEPDAPRRVQAAAAAPMPRVGATSAAPVLPRLAEHDPLPRAPSVAPGRPGPLADGSALRVEAPPRPAPVPPAEQVRTGRLPSIAAEPAPADTAQLDPDADAPDAQEARAPALTRHAADFVPDGDAPLFAVIFVDDGADPAMRARIAELPFPVTVALDPADDGAAEAARSYRIAGHEVMALAPDGLNDDAPAQRVGEALVRVPEAIGLLDRPPEGTFQGDRLLAQQILPELQVEGHALMTQDHGLNPAAQLAQSMGLTQGQVFRVLDAQEENIQTMRRYLDRAAFRAAQQGGVIVLGHARPDTLAALMEWRLHGRAQSVQLAPVSAVLTLP